MNIEPKVTTTVRDGHVCTELTYTRSMLDAMAQELANRLDMELFKRIAPRYGYVPSIDSDGVCDLLRDARNIIRGCADLHVSPSTAMADGIDRRMWAMGIVME